MMENYSLYKRKLYFINEYLYKLNEMLLYQRGQTEIILDQGCKKILKIKISIMCMNDIKKEKKIYINPD